MSEIGIPELMIIGIMGVLAGGVALGFGWIIFGRKRTRGKKSCPVPALRNRDGDEVVLACLNPDETDPKGTVRSNEAGVPGRP